MAWYYWTSSATSSTTTTDTSWTSWNDQGTSTAVSNSTWVRWVTTTSTYIYTVPQETRIPAYQPPPVEETDRYRKVMEKKKAAEAKAMELVLDLLGPEQAVVYKKTGKLLVKGREFDWLITAGGLVSKIKKGKVVRLCVHSEKRSSQPESDNVIALALHAKYAEKELLERAHFVSESNDNEALPEAANF